MRLSGGYGEGMGGNRYKLPRRTRQCPSCDRLVHLNRDGVYRRHFGGQLDGSVRLCAESGHAPPSLLARALRGLDL